MKWIEHGYHLLWTVEAVPRREKEKSSSASEHRELDSNTVAEMTKENTVTMMPPGEKPWVVSPLGVVPKRGTIKFRLTVSMRYVNRYLDKGALKLEGLKDLADLAVRGDYAVSFDLLSGYYHVGLHPRSRTLSGSSGKGDIMCIIASPSDCRHHLGYSPR